MNYMEEEWEAHTNLEDGFSKIEFKKSNRTIIVRNDGITGYDFVQEYLDKMRKNYKSHLMACEMKLKMRLGKSFKTVQKQQNRYQAEVALISLNCCFGKEDMLPDHQTDGAFNPEFTCCSERYHCPFNGFKNKGKFLVCCNPVYECGFTATQAKVAHLIVSTPYSYEEIACQLGCSYSNVDNIRKRIFEKFQINSRQELVIKLKGKRLWVDD